MDAQREPPNLTDGAKGHVATLPAACRPSKRLIFNLNHHQYTSRVDVEVNGKVTWVGGSKVHSWLSLAGIAFPVSAVAGQQVPLLGSWEFWVTAVVTVPSLRRNTHSGPRRW